ncbi:MAG: serine/threonine protein kinase [Acidobacteria bacterium]|nr:serine/threonine protein kinase [Acidobacteriota bacterium]
MKYCPQCQRTYPESTRFCLEDGTGLAKDPHDLFGRTVLGKYKIDSYVAEGGSSAVYTARQSDNGRRVAVKVMLPRVTRNQVQVVDNFLLEASRAAQLRHPNVVEVLEAGKTPEGLGCMVMEMIEGETLEARMKEKGPLGPETTFDLLRQIAAALDAAHRMGIIHRDLKPTKILLLQKGSRRDLVKVVDFAVLNAFSNAFTPSYASPEQCLKSGKLDARSDIYSLGVMLYRMLAGRLPFEASSTADLILMHTTEDPPPLGQFRNDIPPGVEKVILQMLAKKPEDRPASVGDVVRRYEQAITMTNVVRIDDHPELAAEIKRPVAPARAKPEAPVAPAPPAPAPAPPPAAADAFATSVMQVQIEESPDFSTNVMGITPEMLESAAAAPAAPPPARSSSVTMEIREFTRQQQAAASAAPPPQPAQQQIAIKSSGQGLWILLVLGGVLLLAALVAYMLLV